MPLFLRFFLIGFCINSAYADEQQLSQQLKKQYPNLSFEHIASTEMKGVYSATLNQKVVYLDEAGQHLFLGSMIRLKDQENLTQSLNKISNTLWKELPFQNAIKIVKGNGSHQLAVFSDPNCPYCQKLEKELKQLDDVTIYIFLYPIRPVSIFTTKQVWCSPNPAYTWQNLMQKRMPPQNDANCENPIQKNLQLGNQLNFEGTPGLIFANGEKLTGFMSKTEVEQYWQKNNL